VRGCMCFARRFCDWEALRDELDKRIKEDRRAQRVLSAVHPEELPGKRGATCRGLRAEVAVVTHGAQGARRAADRAATSETSSITCSRSGSVACDLPMMLNQWATSCAGRCDPDVPAPTDFSGRRVTLRMRPREEAEPRRSRSRNVSEVVEEFLAIPLIVGRKSAAERFRARPRLTLSKV